MKHKAFLTGVLGLSMISLVGCGNSNNKTGEVSNTANQLATNTATNTTSETTVNSTSITTAPMEIGAIPGAMLSRQQWPLMDANPNSTGTGMYEANYSSSGPIIGGVHWTWPGSDTNPKDYIVIPTTIRGLPYIVWCHLAPQKILGGQTNGSATYPPHQLEPTGPSQMWMTPWTMQGGALSNGATLVTDDIPPVFSTTGQYVFPANLKDSSPQSLASSAWTKWFQWGSVAHPYTLPASKSLVEPTVAVPNELYPADNGVVLSIETQVLQANQGGAVNLYYLDLANHRIFGLASLTNGGGLFSSMRVVSGMVFTGAAAEWRHNGQIKATAYVYDEATGQRVSVESSAVMSQNNGFNSWTIQGSKIYDANNKLQADLNLPGSVTSEPSASTFGVAIQ